MTLNDFKNFLDGFVCGVHKRPTDEQWKMICDKLDSVVAENTASHLAHETLQFDHNGIPVKFAGNGVNHDSTRPEGNVLHTHAIT